MTIPLRHDAVLAEPVPRADTRPRVLTDADSERLWKDIFEKGHAVAAAVQQQAQQARTKRTAPDARSDTLASNPGDAGASVAKQQGIAGVDATPARDGTAPSTSHEAPEGRRLERPTQGMPAGELHSTRPPPNVRAAEGAASTVRASSPLIAAAFGAGPGPDVAALAPAASAAPEQGLSMPEAHAELADEMVQVHEHDGVIQITIRNLGLLPASALRCAIDTARELTGDPRALKRVTLNGTSIYEQRDGVADAPAANAPRPMPVSFTC